MSYCSEKYGSLTIPQMLTMIEERDAAIRSLTGDNLPTSYASEDDTVGGCPYCGGWNMNHTDGCEVVAAEKLLEVSDGD
jgi:hypothetical protein